jgi:hypothetical protein
MITSNNAFLEYSKDKFDELIKFLESPVSAHTGSMASDDIEDAELDEAWDL